MFLVLEAPVVTVTWKTPLLKLHYSTLFKISKNSSLKLPYVRVATPLLHMAVQCERHLCVPLKFSAEPAVKAFLTPLFHLSQIYLIYHLFLDSADTEYESICKIVFWTLYALFRNVLRTFNNLNNSFFRFWKRSFLGGEGWPIYGRNEEEISKCHRWHKAQKGENYHKPKRWLV